MTRPTCARSATRARLSGLVLAAWLACPGAARAQDADAGASDAAPAPATAPTLATAPSPAPTPHPAPTPRALPPDTAPPALAPDTTPLAPFPPAITAPTTPLVRVTPLGYVETYYAYNFNRPSNGVTAFRGFDNRHNTFTLSNAALGATWETGPVSGKVMLQVGSTPSTYYASEPARAGAGGANATGPELWKYLQEAYVTYEAPLGRGLQLTAGLLASPIGMETFAVKDNWNWSRSNLFYALPYYHVGLRATYPVTDALSFTVSAFNGWNAVVDNNEAKSVEAHVTYRLPGRFSAQALYFGGIERSPGAPEGAYWRHHIDAFAQLDVVSWLAVAAQGDYGFEPTRFGTARWASAAALARLRATRWLFFAVRGDRFHEDVASGGGRSSTPLFWHGADWVSSGTVTADVRPHDTISVRLELRHDVAASPLYFRGNVTESAATGAPPAPNARQQTTLLLGVTAWF